MPLSRAFIESQGFTVTESERDPEWLLAWKDNLFIQKPPREEWIISIEYDHDASNYYVLRHEWQVINIVKALTEEG